MRFLEIGTKGDGFQNGIFTMSQRTVLRSFPERSYSAMLPVGNSLKNVPDATRFNFG